MSSKKKSSPTEPTPEELSAPADFSTDGPATGEVDVANLSSDLLPGETPPLLSAESWVILGPHPTLPDWAVGKPAAVLSFPTVTVENKSTGESHVEMAPDAVITVRERTQGATFSLPLASFSKVSPHGGRAEVVNHP